MSSENLTPWDAPIPKKAPQSSGLSPSMQKLLDQLNGKPQGSGPAKPEPKLKWYQFIKKWNRKYKGKSLLLETPFFYLYFGLLISINVPEFFKMEKPGDGVFAAFSIGFIISICIFIKVNQMAKRFAENMNKLDVDFARIEGRMAREIELRDEFRRTGRI